MGHELALALTLGLLAGTTALRTSSNSTGNSLESVATEVGRRCKASDYAGAMAALENYGQPVGASHGKELLKACFMGNDGECQLSDHACGWMQKCLAEDGVCGRPPIVEMLSEIPGGKAALSLAQIAAAKTGESSEAAFQVGLLVDAVKKVFQSTGIADMQKGLAEMEEGHAEGEKGLAEMEEGLEDASEDASEDEKPGKKLKKLLGGKKKKPKMTAEERRWNVINKVADKVAANKVKRDEKKWKRYEKFTNDIQSMKVSKNLKFNLWQLKGAHDVFLDYFPDAKKTLWLYKIADLGMFISLACATEYTTLEGKKVDGYETKTAGITEKSPIYAWFAPKGLFKSPAYTYPILKTKLKKGANKWKC